MCFYIFLDTHVAYSTFQIGCRRPSYNNSGSISQVAAADWPAGKTGDFPGVPFCVNPCLTLIDFVDGSKKPTPVRYYVTVGHWRPSPPLPNCVFSWTKRLANVVSTGQLFIAAITVRKSWRGLLSLWHISVLRHKIYALRSALFSSTNAALVGLCVLSDMKSALCFLYGYRYLGDGDTDRHEILHDGT